MFRIDLFLGGGLRNFIDKGESLPGFPNSTGIRKDGRNLVQDWISKMEQQNKKAKFVKNKSELDTLDAQKVDAVLGLLIDKRLSV